MKQMREHSAGYLAFLLHAHLPYVQNTARDFCLEEKWLFEGLTESYLPMIFQWEQLAREGISFGLTLSLSPTLLSMLTDEALKERYSRYLGLQIELAQRETERTAGDADFFAVTQFYYRRLVQIQDAFTNRYGGNLLNPLKQLADRGHLELITTCATHGYLPLMLTDESRRAQIRAGVQLFQSTLERNPNGLWLPECGYIPGVERLLKTEGINYFIMSGHGLVNSFPQLNTSVYAPAQTGGVAVFGRDYETSHQVWSRSEGYPGDYDYREFYRDIGYDLDYDYVAPYLVAGLRSDTGLKYYRITGKTDHKEPYNLDYAMGKVKQHARDFIQNRKRQLQYWASRMPVKPIITAPYDAELFGHWWFEGPDWLAEVLRLAAQPDSSVQTVTFTNYLEQFPPRQQVTFAHSSWGEGGFSRYWLNPKNDWVYPHYHRAEKVMVQMAETIKHPTPLERRALNQAARELMLAQSSDWPFIITSGTTVDYAQQRLHNHLTNFFKLSRAVKNHNLNEAELALLEQGDQIFPGMDYRIYRPAQNRFGDALKVIHPGKPLILMLSWEFPPQHVGGLGIHVRDLAIELVKLGWNVQVLTIAHDGLASFGVMQGVGVHFIPTCQPLEEHNQDFISWVLQLNLALADYAREFVGYLINPVILHAHDWLVAFAASEIKAAEKVPLITTIHATEHGRNNGIHTPIQQTIHQIESELVKNSDRVICCSRYMRREIHHLFGVPEENLHVISNGVQLIRLPEKTVVNQTILYVGRLVVEKGVQHLLQALPGLIGEFPDIRLVVAGNGPYQHELQEMAHGLGVEDRVEFTGFVSEKRRNQLLAQCRVTVFPSLYEPFGIVALEAMTAGVPVIVARTGGLVETVKAGETGLCFNPGDVGELQNCLRQVMQNPERAETMSRRAKQVARNQYTWEAVARQTSEVYQKEAFERESRAN